MYQGMAQSDMKTNIALPQSADYQGRRKPIFAQVARGFLELHSEVELANDK